MCDVADNRARSSETSEPLVIRRHEYSLVYAPMASKSSMAKRTRSSTNIVATHLNRYSADLVSASFSITASKGYYRRALFDDPKTTTA